MLHAFEGSVSDIVERDYRAGDVFKKRNINFCCGGPISLLETCRHLDINYEELIDELVWATRDIVVPNNLPFEDWDLNFMIDYILNIHHAYACQTIPGLCEELSTFATGHERKLPEINRVSESFNSLSSLLLAHNKQENEIIFPYIRQITDAYRRKEAYGGLFVRTLRKPLNSIQSGHVQIEKPANELKDLTKEFSFPAKACTTHKLLYGKLKAFYDNLVQYKCLETKLLFPKAQAIENRLLQV